MLVGLNRVSELELAEYITSLVYRLTEIAPAERARATSSSRVPILA